MTVERRLVRVRGTVQGVGFRPFVHRRAVALGLSGWVGNDASGVLLEVEGEPPALDALLSAVASDPPPLALVEGVTVVPVHPTGEQGFAIVPTTPSGGVGVHVSADVAPCAECLREMADPSDRRYRYPFVNCTDCGPRYTIIRGVPYDRPATTMSAFEMCARCRAEYADPTDRRFHAQPIACPDCGPQLAWRRSASAEAARGEAALTAAVDCLRGGGTVAVKAVGGYHLACDAADERAVAALRRRKGRDAKPFAVMVRDLAAAATLCELPGPAAALLTSARRPVVVVPRRPGTRVATAVAPGAVELGVLLPSSPLHVLLLEALDFPLVMTSGNRSDEPVVHDDVEASTRLGPIADGVLSHDRPIHIRADDSVVRVTPGGRAQVLRRARGYVPQPVRLPVPAERPVLAVGAELKSTVALARGSAVIASHHLGDLTHWSTWTGFLQAVTHLPALAGVEPAVVAHDLHPDYRSTAWAREQQLPTVGVQHHHAHVAACLVEHGRAGPVLGIVFDGAGFGDDGTLWGGELLLADLVGYRRVGHLAPAALPGGDAAVREPWRMAMSWLHRALGPDEAAQHGSRLDERWAAVMSLVASGRCPETSSVGRLFDAVAALLGVRQRVSYEGQAAIELEALARRAGGRVAAGAPFGVVADRLSPAPVLRQLLHDRARGVPVETLAAGFHLSLAEGTARLAARLAATHGVGTVVLTGGVFANVLLTDVLARGLRRAGLEVLVHEQLPPGDGSISIGQAGVAAARTGRARL